MRILRLWVFQWLPNVIVVKRVILRTWIMCFARGFFARHIWRLATTQLGVHMAYFHTWKEQTNFWFRCASRSSQIRIIFGLLPSIITWKLWERCCKGRYEDKVHVAKSVWHAIKLWLYRIMDQIMKIHSVSPKIFIFWKDWIFQFCFKSLKGFRWIDDIGPNRAGLNSILMVVVSGTQVPLVLEVLFGMIMVGYFWLTLFP